MKENHSDDSQNSLSDTHLEGSIGIGNIIELSGMVNFKKSIIKIKSNNSYFIKLNDDNVIFVRVLADGSIKYSIIYGGNQIKNGEL